MIYNFEKQIKLRYKKSKIMKLKLLVVICCLVLPILIWTKTKSYFPDTYAFTRGVESYNSGNNQDAIDWFNKETDEHPDNGYAYLYLSVIHSKNNEKGKALSNINLAIKKIPNKDKEYKAIAYGTRGNLYMTLEDTINGLKDYEMAIKIYPNHIKTYENRADTYYYMGQYDLADADFNQIIKLDPSNEFAYAGLGRNANELGNYEEAISQFNRAIKLEPEYSAGYAFRAESYMKLGKFIEASDDIMKALSMDSNRKAYYLLFDFPENQLALVINKLKAMSVNNPHSAEWQYYIGKIYENKKMYKEAIEAFNKAFDIDAVPDLLDMIADCYKGLGEYSFALDAITRAEQMQPDEINYIAYKADILGDLGDTEGAIAEWTKYIEKTPDFFGGYYRRGFFEDISNKTDKALEDYNMSITLNPDYAYAYLGKGDMLMRKGMQEDAMVAYRKVIELDTIPNNSSCAMYAFLALGEKDKAIDFMNRVLANDSTYCGNYYDGACFYSRLGDIDKSLYYLRKALEGGFRRFNHIMSDDDLDIIRERDEFKSLMDKYKTVEDIKKIIETDDVENKVGDSTIEQVEIPFTPDSGCYLVKCSVNELPLSFIFDTGASVVSLSQLEANFMLKNGYLKREDFVGSDRFVDANGDVTIGSIINLRKVNIGGQELENVRASIVRNQKAPLLLGQSVLGRLGRIEIDNTNKKLIIKKDN